MKMTEGGKRKSPESLALEFVNTHGVAYPGVREALTQAIAHDRIESDRLAKLLLSTSEELVKSMAECVRADARVWVVKEAMLSRLQQLEADCRCGNFDMDNIIATIRKEIK